MDEGFALRERLDNGESVDLTFRLEVEEPRDLATEYTVATLPGVSDEQIVVMTHTDGYFQAAMDNAAGMASALEIARFYARKPLSERPRTMKFIQFPDHHHGEVARGRDGVGINDAYPWDKVAVKLTMEHPSQTLLYMYRDALTPANAIGAFRWNALGSQEFEQMIFDTLREFGVSVYAIEDGPKNGNYAPSFHIIDHVIYHTSLDVPELVPANGLERSTRAFAAALGPGKRDDAEAATRRELSAKNRAGHPQRGRVAGQLALASVRVPFDSAAFAFALSCAGRTGKSCLRDGHTRVSRSQYNQARMALVGRMRSPPRVDLDRQRQRWQVEAFVPDAPGGSPEGIVADVDGNLYTSFTGGAALKNPSRSSGWLKEKAIMTKRLLRVGIVAGVAVLVGASFTGMTACQTTPEAVQIDPDDIGGVASSASGPEPGVWVIAETTDLPTGFRKIVVTDDLGRYVVPDLPTATYDVWCAATGWWIHRRCGRSPGRCWTSRR